MTIASDNPFPSVLLVEGDPEALATDADTGQRRLAVGTDHALYLVDDAGVATAVGSAVADILDLTTAETDDTLVLAPDGAGGVEFRAEAGGGGGGLAQSFVGYDTIGGTFGAVTATRQLNKKVTLPDAEVVSIGVYVRANGDNWQNLGAGLLTDNAGAPGLVIAAARAQMLISSSTGSFPHAGRWVHVPIGAHVAAGDYWLAISTDVTIWDIASDSGGADVRWDSVLAGAISGAHSSLTPTTTSTEFSIRASILS